MIPFIDTSLRRISVLSSLHRSNVLSSCSVRIRHQSTVGDATTTLLSSLSKEKVRSLTHLLKHKKETQTAFFNNMIEAAEQETSLYAEVGSAYEDSVLHLSTMPLSGVAVAVSDCLDVEGFATRYNANTPLLYEIATTTHPFIRWMLQQGARVTGKLLLNTPLALEECSALEKEHQQPAQALLRGTCHYCVLNSIIGSAGLPSSLHYDVVCFVPGGIQNGPNDVRFVSRCCCALSIVSRSLDDIMYLWQSYTGTLRTIERLSEEGGGGSITKLKDNSTSTGSSLYIENRKKKPFSHRLGLVACAVVTHALNSALDTIKRLKRKSLLDSRNYKHQNDINNNIKSLSMMNYDVSNDTLTQRIWNILRPASPEHTFTSSWQQRRDGVLKVGYPASWIDKYCGDQMTALDFEVRLKTLYEQNKIFRKAYRSRANDDGSSSDRIDSSGRNKGVGIDDLFSVSATSTSRKLTNNYSIEFVPIHIDIDLGSFVTDVVKLAHYDLAQQITKVANEQHKSTIGHISNHRNSSNNGDTNTTYYDITEENIMTTASSNVSALSSSGSAVNNKNTASASKIIAATGFFEELSQSVVSAVFDGRSTSSAEYHRTLQMVTERVSGVINESFIDVDIICCPILCGPYADGNTRSISFTLPYVVNHNPIVSLRLDESTPVMLVGEVGRGTQLLEDAISFADFVKCERTENWLRKKLFGR